MESAKVMAADGAHERRMPVVSAQAPHAGVLLFFTWSD